MNKLKYKFKDIVLDKVEENDINIFLEKSYKKTNCWWSKLPAFVHNYTSWLHYFHDKFMAMKEGTQDIGDGSINTAKSCPAIGKGILDKCFLVKAPCDIVVNLDSKGGAYFDVPDNLIHFTNHPTSQFHTDTDNPFEGMANVKINYPILLSSDLPYMFLPPQFHVDKSNHPFEVIVGYVEKPFNTKIELNLNLLYKIPEGETTILINEGTVLAYLWFPEKVDLEYAPKMKNILTKRFFGAKRLS